MKLHVPLVGMPEERRNLGDRNTDERKILKINVTRA
jgi:hypothetical protein